MRHTSSRSFLSFFIIPLFALMVTIQSCKVDKYPDTLDYAYDYQPMEVGKYWIYDVDSIVYNFIVPSTQQIDTFHYQLLESITDTFYDNQNRLNYRLELSTRIDTGNNTPWTFWKVWYCYKSARTFERQEDDLRFMKLVFPIQSDIAWNGNIFIPVNDTDDLKLYSGWNYKYSNFAKPSLINGQDFNETVEVDHVDEENLIDKRKSYELYAKGVGQIFRHLEKINKQDVNAPWDNPYRANGFRYIKRINSYGP